MHCLLFCTVGECCTSGTSVSSNQDSPSGVQTPPPETQTGAPASTQPPPSTPSSPTPSPTPTPSLTPSVSNQGTDPSTMHTHDSNQPPPSSDTPPLSSSGDQTSNGTAALSEVVGPSSATDAISSALSSATSTQSVPTLNSSSPSTPSLASSSSGRSKAGPIAGGVIGGLIILLLAVLGIFLWKRRVDKKRVAPSAEFMHHNRLTPSLSHARPLRSSYSDIEDDQPPPPFTRGSFKDPLFEKVSQAAAQRELYTSSPYRDDLPMISSVHTSASVGSPLRNVTPEGMR